MQTVCHSISAGGFIHTVLIFTAASILRKSLVSTPTTNRQTTTKLVQQVCKCIIWFSGCKRVNVFLDWKIPNSRKTCVRMHSSNKRPVGWTVTWLRWVYSKGFPHFVELWGLLTRWLFISIYKIIFFFINTVDHSQFSTLVGDFFFLTQLNIFCMSEAWISVPLRFNEVCWQLWKKLTVWSSTGTQSQTHKLCQTAKLGQIWLPSHWAAGL